MAWLSALALWSLNQRQLPKGHLIELSLLLCEMGVAWVYHTCRWKQRLYSLQQGPAEANSLALLANPTWLAVWSQRYCLYVGACKAGL